MAALSTSMDQLVELLQARNSIKVSEAAHSLGVDKERVESWAKMLEKAGAVEIHYSVIGGAILKKGKAFDSLIKSSVKGSRQHAPVSHGPTSPAPATPAGSGDAPSKSPSDKKDALSKGPSASGRLPSGETHAGDASGRPAGNYRLIRKELFREERELKQRLEKLRQEEITLADAIRGVVDESNRIIEDIESLKAGPPKAGKGK